MKKVITAFVFLMLTTIESEAQTQEIKFNLITGSNGISLGKVNAITRDKYGFVWFSDQTNRCIIRYDGSKMIKFQNDPQDSNSLGGTYPECLFADPSGIIWVGFYGMGLDRFDPQSNTFVHYRHNQNDPGSLSNNYVTAILADHLGNIWVGNYGGLDLLDEKTGKFKHYSSKANERSSLSCNKVRALFEDRAGDLWVGTGFAYDEGDEGGLNRFNRNTGTFTRYLHDPQNPRTLVANKVRGILEDSYGNFWVGTNGDGLQTLDRKTGLVTRYPYNPERPEQLSRPALQSFFDHITFISEDADRKLWIGTLSNGITRYDPETKKITRYPYYDGKVGNDKDTSSWCACATPDGLIWMSTQKANLYKIDLHNSLISNFGNANDVANAFFEESPSVLWLGTPRGLIRRNLNDGTAERFVHEESTPGTLSSNDINAILKDKNGRLWIGTGTGLNLFNPKTKNFTIYPDNPGNNTDASSIAVLYEGVNSTIWAGTNGRGLKYLDSQTGKLTQFKFNSNSYDTSIITPRYITPRYISSILEDSIYLWLGTPDVYGVFRTNPQTGSLKNYLPELTVFCLYKDKDAVMWVGTDGGLFRYDTESDKFISGAKLNDYLNIPNAISIIGDDENNLWVVSTPGIYKINRKRNFAILYAKENGIPEGNSFFFRSVYKAQDGKLYFGNRDGGYLAFYPGKIDKKSVPVQLWFTNFLLNNIEIKPGTNSILQQSIFDTKDIQLDHDQNTVSFVFSVIDFQKGNNKVYYKLENYDNDWRTAGSENKAEYFRIPPGKYALHIRTTNNSNGEWIEKNIRIIILPPWWRAWWAYCMYAILFLALLFFAHRYQKTRVIKAERERTRAKEIAQAKEIEKAYNGLRTTQAQLIQAEKMASLGELTAGIAHEIQNPLNFINNFSEVNTELIDELQQELKAGNDNEVITISNNIKENQKKINHHGKRADAIVKGMLQHSRNSNGQKEATNINVLADEYLRLAYHGFRAKDKSFNASMKTDFDETIGKINIIPQDIGRVVLNLINNAFYAVDEKRKQNQNGYEPTVSVSTRKENNKVEIKVKDDGNGIPQEVLDKIFQPFFTTKPTGQGTGLGLSLSYDIVKAHNGEIKVNTREGEFTEFVVQLPISV